MSAIVYDRQEAYQTTPKELQYQSFKRSTNYTKDE